MADSIHGERVTLRPIVPGDLPRLREILAEPEVERWWGADAELPPARTFAVEREGETIGAIQYWEEDDPAYRHAAIDVFLATAHQNEGLGPDAVRTLARWLVDEHGHHRLTIDPALENERAIRAYERVGFRRVGVLRRYERRPDGTFRDGLLMDLLADELTR